MEPWTPGPWHYEDDSGKILPFVRDDTNLPKPWVMLACPPFDSADIERTSANMRLIALAPEMAEVLESLVVALNQLGEHGTETDYDAIDVAGDRAAMLLAKARGERA